MYWKDWIVGILATAVVFVIIDYVGYLVEKYMAPDEVRSKSKYP